MEVGSDVSTKRPLLNDDDEGANVSTTAASPSRPSQQSWVRRGRRAQDIRYGPLGEASGPNELDNDAGADLDDDERQLLGRLEDGFYECEEEVDDTGSVEEVEIEEICVDPTQSCPDAAQIQHPVAVTSEVAFEPRGPTPESASSAAVPFAVSSSALQPMAADAREMRMLPNASGGVGIEDEEYAADRSGMSTIVPGRTPACSPRPVSGGLSFSPTRGPTSADRHCFICLQDDDKDFPLTPCCTTCYASVHVRCWREWRNNQRITALRSRLLGLRMQTNNLLRCTICKSGTAVVAGEEDGLEWMNEFLCGTGGSEERGDDTVVGTRFGGVRPAAQMRRDESDEDGDAQLEDLVDMKTCLALVVYLGVLILVLLIACLLIVMQRFYAGDVILCCIIALYELSVLQIVALAIARRRAAPAGLAATTHSENSNPAGGEDLEMGVQQGHGEGM